MIFLSLSLLIGSYAMSSLALASLFSYSKFPFASGLSNLLISPILAPIFIAWQLWVLFLVLPGLPLPIVIIIPFVISLLALIILRKNCLSILHDVQSKCAAAFRSINASWFFANWPLSALLFGIFILALATVTQILSMPVINGDPLQYLTHARILATELSLANYPANPAWQATGFFANSVHPPAYYLMIVWGYLLAGTTDTSQLLRITHIWLFLSFLIVIAQSLFMFARTPRQAKILVICGVFLALVTPSYLALTTALHIEPVRLPLFLLLLVFLSKLPEARPSILQLSIIGFVLALGLFSHSSGLLLLPLVVGAFVVLGPGRIMTRLIAATVIVMMAVLIGGGQYVINFLHTGSPVSDSLAVWNLPGIDQKQSIRLARDLLSPMDRVWNGLLIWFHRPEIFGYLHFIALISVVFGWKQIKQNRLALYSLFAIVAFYALAAASLMLGFDLMIKNHRYLLSLLPFLIFISAIGYGSFLARLGRNDFTLINLSTPRLLLIIATISSMAGISHYSARQALGRSLYFNHFNDIWFGNETDVLTNSMIPGADTVSYIRENLTAQDRIFTFSQGLLGYYTNATWLRAQDDQTLAFHQMSNPKHGANWLRAQGVTFILISTKPTALFENGITKSIIGDAELTHEVFAGSSLRLFALHRPAKSNGK